MKKHLQKFALLGLLITILPSCQALMLFSEPEPNRIWDHWNADSIPPRVDRFFLGYDSDVDGSYANKLGTDLGHIRKTCQRIFLNRNEENPFQN